MASSLLDAGFVKPVLEAILNTGANSVSVILSPSILPDTFIELPSRFTLGVNQDMYAHLDDQILAIAQNTEDCVSGGEFSLKSYTLTQICRNRWPCWLWHCVMKIATMVWCGLVLINRVCSLFRCAFCDHAGWQAALAIANAHLFMNVEASRRQLEAVLNSTTDPVLVTDHRNRSAAHQSCRSSCPRAECGENERTGN